MNDNAAAMIWLFVKLEKNSPIAMNEAPQTASAIEKPIIGRKSNSKPVTSRSAKRKSHHGIHVRTKKIQAAKNLLRTINQSLTGAVSSTSIVPVRFSSLK